VFCVLAVFVYEHGDINPNTTAALATHRLVNRLY